ncbi:MAG: hypothetical protein V8T86_00930 [Victivallis sp.]
MRIAHPSDYVREIEPRLIERDHIRPVSMLRVVAPVRFIDRPYMVSEYGQVFWNRFRRRRSSPAAMRHCRSGIFMMVHSTWVVPRAANGCCRSMPAPIR